jgi:hypothetical protein
MSSFNAKRLGYYGQSNYVIGMGRNRSTIASVSREYNYLARRTSNPLYSLFQFGTNPAPPEPMTNVPPAPINLSVTVDVGSASISFIQPSNGGTPITNYEYKILDISGATFEPFIPSQTTSPVTISGLMNDRLVTLVLRAVNAKGKGASSEVISFTTPPDVSMDGLEVSLLPQNGNSSTWTNTMDNQNATMTGPPDYNSSIGYTFNGTTQYGRLNSQDGVTNFTNADDYTVEIWFNPSIGQPNSILATVLEKWNSTNQPRYPYVFRYAEISSTLAIAVYDGSTNPTVFISEVKTGTWHQVVCVFNFTTNILSAYKNGVDDENTVSLVGVNNVSNTSQVGIAHRINNISGNAQFMFKGSIGIIRIYNRALTSSEVMQNFNANKNIYGI